MALVLLICMVVSFAPAAYADVDEAPAVQEETVVEESTVKNLFRRKKRPSRKTTLRLRNSLRCPPAAIASRNCSSFIAPLMTPMPIRPTTGSAAM